MKSGLGFFYSALSAFLWGTVYIAGRGMMREGAVDPVTLSLLRFGFAGGLMMIAGLLTRQPMFRVTRRDVGVMACQGMIGMAGMSVLLFYGQQTTSAVNSSIIMTATPVLVLLAERLRGRRIVRMQWAGMAVATLGCFLVIKVVDGAGFHAQAFGRGDLLTLGSAGCWMLFTLWGRETVRRIGGYVYTTYITLGAVPLLLLFASLNAPAIVLPQDRATWCVCLYLALFPTTLGFLAWNAAQRLISLPLLNIMQYLTPISVLALSWPILGERCTPLQVAGVALVIAGVALDPSLRFQEWRPRCRVVTPCQD